MVQAHIEAVKRFYAVLSPDQQHLFDEMHMGFGFGFGGLGHHRGGHDGGHGGMGGGFRGHGGQGGPGGQHAPGE